MAKRRYTPVENMCVYLYEDERQRVGHAEGEGKEARFVGRLRVGV